MSETANPSADPARLDELAEVTREYARYSRTAFGIAAVAMGGWVIVSTVADIAGAHAWAHVAYALVPLGWVVLSRRARKLYQRRGVVVQPEQDPIGGVYRAVVMALACILLVMGAVNLTITGWTWARAGGIPTEIALFVAVGGLLAAAWLAPRWSAGVKHGQITASVSVNFATAAWLWFCGPTDSVSAVASVIFDVLWAGFALLAIGFGLHEHRRYRGLERRLDALRVRT